MKVLFIGGTGIISSGCSPLVVEKGMSLTLLNRGETDRKIPEGTRVIHGNIRDTSSLPKEISKETFDAVVNWINFTPDQVQSDIAFFKGRIGQYVFISSASAYQTPPASLPVTESTPLHNPVWEYSQNKIACEKLLLNEYRSHNFPITIVRPSHTYDERTLPFTSRYTVINRMRTGKKVIIHGDGTSLWVLTHHRDFAKGFVGLLGNSRAIGETVHITSDEMLNWNQIYQIMAEKAGARHVEYVHIPSEVIASYDKDWGDNLLGDKAISMIFDNSKIKRLVPGFQATIPFSLGAEEVMTWFDANPARQIVDSKWDALMDRLVMDMESIGKR